MTNRPDVQTRGFSKVRPLSEGYVVKGGINRAFQITERPPAPAQMRPAAGEAKPVRGSKKNS